jgi:hypothetical protein
LKPNLHQPTALIANLALLACTLGEPRCFASTEATSPATAAAATSNEKNTLEPRATPAPRTKNITARTIVGSAIGFGVGHMLTGRWLERGWIFAVGEPILLVAFLTGVIGILAHPTFCFETYPTYNSSKCQRYHRERVLHLGLSALAFGSLRAWDVSDLWRFRARARQQTNGNAANELSSVSVYPVVQWGGAMGIGTAYRF